MEEVYREAKNMIAGLVQGSVSRDEAADWATERIKDESADYSSDPVLWTALDRLAGSDLEKGPGAYLHGEADFAAWLADLNG